MLPNLGTSGSQFSELVVPKRWNQFFRILEPRVPSSTNQRLPNLGTNASQSRNHRYAVLGTNGSQTLEPMLYPNLEPRFPVLGTNGSQTLEPILPNLGTNASKSWNLRFPVFGTSGSQTLGPMFSKLGTSGSQFYQSAIVSKAATIGSELRDTVYFKNYTFPCGWQYVWNFDTNSIQELHFKKVVK